MLRFLFDGDLHSETVSARMCEIAMRVIQSRSDMFLVGTCRRAAPLDTFAQTARDGSG